MVKSDIAVKRYYIETERYDWTDVVDHFRGLESIFHWNRQRVISSLVKSRGASPRFLDVGCGTGLVLRGLPSDSVGLDVNPWNVRKAKGYAPHTELVVGDAENMPFRDDIFSTVICTETLEHLPNPNVALREVRRVLRSKGKLVGSVPHKSIFWRFRFLSSTCPREEPFHNQYAIEQVRRLLSDFKMIYIRLSSLRLNVVFVSEK